MTNINDLAGYAECGSENIRGYNTSKGSAPKFGILQSIYITSADVKLTGDFNKKMFVDLQKEGKLDIITGILTSSESGTDNIYETLDSGQDLKAGDAVYRYDLTFNKGEYFNKAITYLAGSNKRVYLVDRNGNIKLANNGGNYQGFLLSMIDVNKMTMQTDTAASKQSLKIQFASAQEFTQRAEIIEYSDELDFNPATLEDKTQAFIKFKTVADADDKIDFELLVDQGRSSHIVGVSADEAFQLTINGTKELVKATETSNVYSITKTIASSDIIELKINKVQEDADGDLYCSAESKIVVP